jgi:hypothetical protein
MSDCAQCKEWAKLMHAVLPSLWREMNQVGHLLTQEEEQERANMITLIEDKVRDALGDRRHEA